MEAKIIILGMSPRLPYLKSDKRDFFSISFLYDDNIIKIEDLEKSINSKEIITIPIVNISRNKLHFYLIKNGSFIIGIGEIPLINSVKWFDLNEFNSNKQLNFDIKEYNHKNNIKDKFPTLSTEKNNLIEDIINTNNIKFKLSIEIKNNNNENYNINQTNNLQKSISIKGSGDSNSNSISNTCSNSKTPKNIKNPSTNILTKNHNILLKNNNPSFKKIEIYSKNKSGNNTLFSSINNRLLRNQTEKKLNNKNGKKEKVFSFNDYYDINYNNNTEVNGSIPNITASNENILNLTNLKRNNNNLYNKRKKILTTIGHFSNLDRNNSSKILNNIVKPKNDYLSNKKNKSKSNKKVKIQANLFVNKNEGKEKSQTNEKNINSNSLKKIEEMIIDQNFKNEIKNDEIIRVSSHNSSIISSFYSTKNNFFYNTNSVDNNVFEQNNLLLDINKENDEILFIDFKFKKKEFFNKYNLEFIQSIKNNLLFLESHSFIHKIIDLQNDYQNKYKELYFNFIRYKALLELFQNLMLYTTKKKQKLEYIKTSHSLRENKNELINKGLKSFNNTRSNIINNNKIQFWDKLFCRDNIIQNKYSNINKNNKKKIELIHIFLEICQRNNNYFNSLSKKCYNDIKNKYSKEQNNKILKVCDKRNNNSISEIKQLTQTNTSVQVKKLSTKNLLYPQTENNINTKTPKNKYIAKKSCNFKKEGLILEKNKISSLYNKNISKKNKNSIEKIGNKRK